MCCCCPRRGGRSNRGRRARAHCTRVTPPSLLLELPPQRAHSMWNPASTIAVPALDPAAVVFSGPPRALSRHVARREGARGQAPNPHSTGTMRSAPRSAARCAPHRTHTPPEQGGGARRSVLAAEARAAIRQSRHSARPARHGGRAPLAFKDSMTHGVLHVTPRIAARCVLHRCENQDIHCWELCCHSTPLRRHARAGSAPPPHTCGGAGARARARAATRASRIHSTTQSNRTSPNKRVAGLVHSQPGKRCGGAPGRGAAARERRRTDRAGSSLTALPRRRHARALRPPPHTRGALLHPPAKILIPPQVHLR